MEDRVRSQFDYPLIGEKWKHETALYRTVCHIFGKEKVEFHAHPSWLQSLELDVYIPSKQLAFEYQGEQHYRPMAHWGGKKAFKVLQEHDERKKLLCKENGVALIEITYLDDITEELIREKMKLNK